MFEELVWPVLRRMGGLAFSFLLEGFLFYKSWWKESENPPLHNNEDKLSLTERARRRRDRWNRDPRDPD